MAETYSTFRAKLDEISPAFREAFEEAVADITNTAQMASLEAAIANGDIQAALRALNLGPEFWAPLDRAMGQAFEQGAIWQLSQTLPKGAGLAGRLQIRFNGRHTRAEAWTRSHGARLVTEVAASVQEAVQVVIEDGLAAGRGPRKVALDVAGKINRATGSREGGIVGLTGQQARYVTNARAELENLDGAYFERKLRDGRFDRTIAKAIREGKPLAQADIDRIIGRYSDRMLKHRGEVISRTEALTALNAGRHEGIMQMAEKAGLPESAVMVEWVSTPDSRTRDSHRSLHGSKVKMGEPFITENGHRMRYPGDSALGAPASETISCRCSTRTRIMWDLVAATAA